MSKVYTLDISIDLILTPQIYSINLGIKPLKSVDNIFFDRCFNAYMIEVTSASDKKNVGGLFYQEAKEFVVNEI